MRYLALLLLLAFPASLWAQEPVTICKTDPEKYWVCAGDAAWGTGWLLEPDVLTMEQVKLWKETAALVPALETERDTFQQQRDAALRDVGLWEEDYDTLKTYSEEVKAELVKAQDMAEDRFTALEVLGIGLGAGGTGLLIGFLVGAFAL
jgi:hypothetical protein